MAFLSVVSGIVCLHQLPSADSEPLIDVYQLVDRKCNIFPFVLNRKMPSKEVVCAVIAVV